MFTFYIFKEPFSFTFRSAWGVVGRKCFFYDLIFNYKSTSKNDVINYSLTSTFFCQKGQRGKKSSMSYLIMITTYWFVMYCLVFVRFSGESSHGWSWCRFVGQYSTSRNTCGRFRFYVKKTQNYIHQSPSARTTMLLNCSVCWFHTAINYHTRWASRIRTLCLLQTLLEVDEDADFSRTGRVSVGQVRLIE